MRNETEKSGRIVSYHRQWAKWRDPTTVTTQRATIGDARWDVPAILCGRFWGRVWHGTRQTKSSTGEQVMIDSKTVSETED